MSSSTAISFGILVSLVFAGPCLAQTDSAIDQQVKSDEQTLSAEQQQLADYQKQAKWYDQFAQQRLSNAAAERAEVEKRLKAITEAQVKAAQKNPKSPIAQEITALQAWLNDESAKRRQIEQTRERWRTAIETELAKVQQTKYQKDVDTASQQHQQELAKEDAARKADNPKPAPPQVQQNTILMPGWETGTGSIPVIEQGLPGSQGAKGQ